LNGSYKYRVLLADRLGQDKLSELAQAIRSLDGSVGKTFILYYLPGMRLDKAAWATTHFSPEFSIQIFEHSVMTNQPYERLLTDENRDLLAAVGTPVTNGNSDISAYRFSRNYIDTDKSSAENDAALCWGHSEADAYVQAQDAMKKSLVAPGTAKFPWIDFQFTRRNCEWTIHSWVDSENGLGATIRTNYTASVTFTAENEADAEIIHTSQ